MAIEITKEDIQCAWKMAYETNYPIDLLDNAVAYFNKHQYSRARIILLKDNVELGVLSFNDILKFKAGLHPKFRLPGELD